MDLRVRERKRPRQYFEPPLRLRVKGDGLQWHGPGRRPTPRDDILYHSERWKEEEDGTHVNMVLKRKSKRRFPDLPPLKSG